MKAFEFKIRPMAAFVATAIASYHGNLIAADTDSEYHSLAKGGLEVLSIDAYDTVKKPSLREFDNYYTVVLESAPLAETSAVAPASAAKTGNRFDINSAAAKKHSNILAKERSTFARELNAIIPGAKTERHFDSVLNAVVVTSKDDIFEALKTVPGVTKVYKETFVHTSMDTSLSLINAPAIWDQLGGQADAGKGVKVAIIDTGIRPENAMFNNDEGFDAPDNLPTDDYCSVAPNFCNNKLIVARAATPTFEIHPDEHLSPLDYNDHGTHVAGTAVGNPTSITFQGSEVDISGVAPGAYLMVYKGLFTRPTGRGSGSDIMLGEMLERAFEDGADVINNSWGGGDGSHPDSSPYQEIFKRLEDAGVLTVTAAGNGEYTGIF